MPDPATATASPPASRSAPRRAPVVRGLPIVGCAFPMRRDPLGFLDRTFEAANADAIYLKLGPYSGTLSRNPDHIRRILVDNSDNYVKQTRAYHKSRLVLGQGMVTSEGQLWQRQRRIATPAFQRQRLAGFAPVMTGATEQMLAQWRARADAGAPLDVFQEMMRLTLRLALQTLLGTSADADLVKLSVTVTEILVRTNDIITNPLYPPLWLPLPRSVSFKRAVRDLDEFVYRTIAARRAGGGNATDLLSMLLAARDDQTGQGMSDQQLRDEAVTTLIAGHETTANALTWALYLVSEHADVREALRAELTAVLGGRTPTFDDLPRLRYTRAVLDETMRLYPPAWMISRRAIEADQIGPYDIAPGEFVLISPYLLHRNPDLWDDVLRFDPQRFLDGRADALPKCAYMPFGAGPRFCIGATFALIEATLVLATVARRVDLSVIPGFPVVPYAMITLRPRHGLKMTPRFVGDR